MEPEPITDRLRFDEMTPTPRHMVIQAKAIAGVAAGLLLEQGWGVLGREEEVRNDMLTGHLDIRAWHTDHGEAVIDLKTGGQIGAAWLQVGGYITLTGLATWHWGACLHVPRVRIDKDTKGTLETRKAHDLIVAWWANLNRIQRVMDGSTPTFSPGMHCGRCGLASCAVRIGRMA